MEALVNPFRTPDHVAKALLPAPWFDLSRRLREAGQRALPLQHLAARAGAAPEEVREVERWLTVAGEGQPLNVTALPEGYLPVESGGVRAHLRAGQTREVWVSVFAHLSF